jgi:hypothetical protein
MWLVSREHKLKCSIIDSGAYDLDTLVVFEYGA